LSHSIEKKKVSISTFILPFIVCGLIVFFHYTNLDSRNIFGIRPQNIDYLIGIFLAPFAHSDSNHLVNNTVPLFFLMSLLIHFFDLLSYRLIFLMYFFTGLGMWFFCPLGHNIIGASGVLYCLASFLFFSGLIRKNRQLMSISLIIVFLYGSMFWGIFDLPNSQIKNISWESHRIGFVLGILFSVIFKSKGPQKKKYQWEHEEEDIEIVQQYRYTIKK
tara:strand:- start:509 stop:1162 length:654 start_codon:yes stop_codon:yes gene_type:complete